MDLSKLLQVPGETLKHVFVEVEDDFAESVTEVLRNDRRQFAMKRKVESFTKKESRTLKAIQATEKRRDIRQEKHFAVRCIENDESIVEKKGLNEQIDVNGPNEYKKPDVKTKSMREKLNEYLEQKKKLEDMKRKIAKPAFKAGIVHHPLAPNKDDAFSTNSRTMSAKPKPSSAKNSMQAIENRLIKKERRNVVTVKDLEKDKIVSVPKPVPEPMRSRWSTGIPSSGPTSSSFKLPMILEFSSQASEQGNSTLFKFGEENTAPNTEQDDKCHHITSNKGDDDKEGYEMNGSEGLRVSMKDAENLNDLATTITPSMSKEALAWCLMTACMTRTSYSHTQLLYVVRRIFKVSGNSLVNKTETCLPSLFNMATSTLQKYWRSPLESKLLRTDQGRVQSIKKHLDSISSRDSTDYFLNSSRNFIKDILGEDIVIDSHPLLAETSQAEFRAFIRAALAPGAAENTELYRFMMEVFTEHDRDEVGKLGFTEFSAMIDEVMWLPIKLSVCHEFEDLLKLQKHRQMLFKACTEERSDQICLKGWIKFAIKQVYNKLT